MGTSALGGARFNPHSSLDSVGLVLVLFVCFFKEEILGCHGSVAYLAKLFIGIHVRSWFVFTIPVK